MMRGRGRAAAVLIGTAGLTLLTTGAAQAHVRVSAPKAVVGQPATLDFMVPSEEQVAGTVRVSFTLPADVAVRQVHPAAGWMSARAEDSAGDTVVTFTTRGSGLAPDQSANFFVDVAALPDRPAIGYDAVQTYSDGDVVYWNQKLTGSAEPPFPAPTLELAGAGAGTAADYPALTPSPDGPASTSTSTGGTAAAGAPTVKAAEAAASVGTPGWVIGLAIAGAGILGAALAALVTTMLHRRSTAARVRVAARRPSARSRRPTALRR